jgi:hypothetical protein
MLAAYTATIETIRIMGDGGKLADTVERRMARGEAARTGCRHRTHMNRPAVNAERRARATQYFNWPKRIQPKTFGQDFDKLVEPPIASPRRSRRDNGSLLRYSLCASCLHHGTDTCWSALSPPAARYATRLPI